MRDKIVLEEVEKFIKSLDMYDYKVETTLSTNHIDVDIMDISNHKWKYRSPVKLRFYIEHYTQVIKDENNDYQDIKKSELIGKIVHAKNVDMDNFNYIINTMCYVTYEFRRLMGIYG